MAGKKEEEVRKNRRFFSDIPPKNPVRGVPLPKHTQNVLKSVVKRCGTPVNFLSVYVSSLFYSVSYYQLPRCYSTTAQSSRLSLEPKKQPSAHYAGMRKAPGRCSVAGDVKWLLIAAEPTLRVTGRITKQCVRRFNRKTTLVQCSEANHS